MLSSVSASVLLATLLSGLDSPRFPCRERAHRTLAQLGRLALPALESGATSHRPEVAARCRCLLAPYLVELADRESRRVMPTHWPRLPWITCVDLESVPMGDENAAWRFLEDARRAGVKDAPPDWQAYREATRLWVRSLILQRIPVEEIRRGLDRMANEERWWIQANSHNYNPPLRVPEGY